MNTIDIDTSIKIAGIILTILIITVLGKRWGWFELMGGTNKLLREQNTELRSQNKMLRDKLTAAESQHLADKEEATKKHLQNEKKISQLQGQIDTLTKIPLNGINHAIDEISKTNKQNAETNEKILSVLISHDKPLRNLLDKNSVK